MHKIRESNQYVAYLLCEDLVRLFMPEGFKQYSKRYIPDCLAMILVVFHFAFQLCLLLEHQWTTSEPDVVLRKTKLKPTQRERQKA